MTNSTWPHIILFVFLDNDIRLSKGQLWKHLCSPSEGHPISTNIKSITWLTGCPSRYWLVQITLYQMTQLPKDACGPYRFKDFLGIFYYIKSWSRELHIKPNVQLETVLGERRVMSMHCSKILLKDFCNPLSVFYVYHRGFSPTETKAMQYVIPQQLFLQS